MKIILSGPEYRLLCKVADYWDTTPADIAYQWILKELAVQGGILLKARPEPEADKERTGTGFLSSPCPAPVPALDVDAVELEESLVETIVPVKLTGPRAELVQRLTEEFEVPLTYLIGSALAVGLHAICAHIDDTEGEVIMQQSLQGWSGALNAKNPAAVVLVLGQIDEEAGEVEM